MSISVEDGLYDPLLKGHFRLYDPLAKGHFRLLRLLPVHDQRNPTEGELSIHDLNSAPPFEALSYTWGDPEPRRTILLGTERIGVTQNLFDALRRLRQNRAKRVLWVDAICIDQNNISEKSSQFALLGDIYAKAKNVVLYIGETRGAAGQSWRYMTQIEEVGSSQTPSKVKFSEITGAEDDLKIKEGFRDILARRLFQNVWNLQDIFNARAAVVQSSSGAISSKTFVHASRLWLEKLDGLSQLVLELMLDLEEMPKQLLNIDSTTFCGGLNMQKREIHEIRSMPSWLW